MGEASSKIQENNNRTPGIPVAYLTQSEQRAIASLNLVLARLLAKSLASTTNKERFSIEP
jgi:hypothetical protein